MAIIRKGPHRATRALVVAPLAVAALVGIMGWALGFLLVRPARPGAVLSAVPHTPA